MKARTRTKLFRRSQLLLGSLGGLGLLSTSILAQTAPRATPLAEERSATNVRQSAGTDFEQVQAEEHLTRGPLHEAFADPYEADPRPSPVVPQQPPEPINEVPPEYRPDGENVIWVPGYWSWDDDRSDFIWVSGVWRDVPPDHQWVPGYWTQAADGYQFISGFWASTQIAELEYLPPPPESLEQGPSSPAPGDTYFYIPGHWVYNGNDYQWQPGYWAVNQESWVWIPAQYVWTPRGCVYQAGYWDYDISYRGLVFTPVYYQQPIYRSPQYVYRPQYVVDTGPELFVHMFVRPNYGQYYYGDYYGARYSNSYQPWTTYYQGAQYYDPFYTNYRVRSQLGSGLNLLSWIVNQHQVFAQNDRYRPATTIAAQRNFLNASSTANLDQTILRLTNLGDSLDHLVSSNNTNINFQQLDQTAVERIVQTVAPLRDLGEQRLRVESGQAADAGANAGTNANVSANGEAAASVSLAETRQRLQAALGAEANGNANANANANATADAAASDRPGDQGDSPASSRPLRDLLGGQSSAANANGQPNAEPTDSTADQGKSLSPASADAVAEATETGREANRPGQEPNARGRDNPRQPQANGRGNMPNNPTARDSSTPATSDAPDAIAPGPGRSASNDDSPNASDANTSNTNASDKRPSVQPGTDVPGDVRNQPNRSTRPGRGANRPDVTDDQPDVTNRGNRPGSDPTQPDAANRGRAPAAARPSDAGLGNSQRPGQNGAGGSQRMRPARPEDWPTAPRRERGRGVPEIPQAQGKPSTTPAPATGSRPPRSGRAGRPDGQATPSAAVPSKAAPSAATPSAATPSAATPSAATPSAATAPPPQAAVPTPQAAKLGKADNGKGKGNGKGKDKEKDK